MPLTSQLSTLEVPNVFLIQYPQEAINHQVFLKAIWNELKIREANQFKSLCIKKNIHSRLMSYN